MMPISLRETSKPQFPTRINRKNILKNGEFSSANKEIFEHSRECLATLTGARA